VNWPTRLEKGDLFGVSFNDDLTNIMGFIELVFDFVSVLRLFLWIRTLRAGDHLGLLF
jgi:hypothetical protein